MPIQSYIKLYLIRHGKDYATELGKFDPHSSLTEDGRIQMSRIGNYMIDRKISRIISSPLNRAKESSDLISQKLNRKVEINDLLRERDQGDASLLSFEQVKRKFSLQLEKNVYAKNWGFPNGELNGEVYTRVNIFLQKLLMETQGISENIIVISHAAPLNYMINQLLGIGFREEFSFHLEPGTLVVLKQGSINFQISFLSNLL